MVYKIFIVEDDKVISQKMAEFLSSWNYQVRQVHDFSKVMEEFIAFDPDLILMDGGKGQVSAVQNVLDQNNLQIPLWGMFKDDKHRTKQILCLRTY